MNKILAILLIAISACIPVHGIYALPELKKIPLERLIANINERVKEDPYNIKVLHQLARAHAMAYARNIADTDLVTIDNARPNEPFLGNNNSYVPFASGAEVANEKRVKSSKAHLATAIEIYKKILPKPDVKIPSIYRYDYYIIQAGLAWCQDQAGEKTAAIALYRKVAEAAWLNEGQSVSVSEGEVSLVVEAANYLIPNLNPKQDAAEIAVLKERKKKIESLPHSTLPRAISPIIIPLAERTALAPLINRDARVRFDLDGTGRQLEWQWINPDAAWLVFDPQHTGKITSAIQMFGNRTFLLFCPDGYQALSLLDDNRDGNLTGHELNGLALWRDANANGISEPGEVRPVTSHGITSLSTHSQQHQTGIPFSPNGVTFQDLNTRPTYDIILQTRPPQ